MSETFTSINYEVYISGAWVSLTADVRHNPSPRITGIGIMGYGPLDRVGTSGRLSFALDNSDTNSHGKLGYYSPGHANCLTGWTTGLQVRVYFVYDGHTKYLYFKINPNGISVTPGQLRRRDVKVECSNWMREAENQTVDLMEYQTNLRAEQGIQRVIDNMPNSPLAISFQTGTRTFPTVFDTTSKKTKAISEINKLVMSEFGYCYLKGDETLVFENRTYRYGQRENVTSIPKHTSEAVDYLLLETGDKVLLETSDKILLEAAQNAIFDEGDWTDMIVRYGEHIYNRAKLTSYPRKVDASPVVLWTLEEPLSIAANATVSDIRGSYRDPNGKSTSVSGINMITPVASTDYVANTQSDGGGSNVTASLTVNAVYGTSEVEYTLTNTTAATMYVTTLQARGYGVYIYDTAYVQYDSLPSIQQYGVSETNIDMPYMSDATNLFAFSNNLDRVLMENSDNAITEDSLYLIHDDESGIFDLLLMDAPDTYINSVTFTANRDKFNMLAFMSLDAGSYIKIQETVAGITTDYSYVINGWDAEIKSGSLVEWSPVLVSTLQCPKV